MNSLSISMYPFSGLSDQAKEVAIQNFYEKESNDYFHDENCALANYFVASRNKALELLGAHLLEPKSLGDRTPHFEMWQRNEGEYADDFMGAPLLAYITKKLFETVGVDSKPIEQITQRVGPNGKAIVMLLPDPEEWALTGVFSDAIISVLIDFCLAPLDVQDMTSLQDLGCGLCTAAVNGYLEQYDNLFSSEKIAETLVENGFVFTESGTRL